MLPYLDVPFQHAHPDVLKRMKRPASGERNLERLARWREICPQIVVRSTFIAGFPGETEAEFEHLLDFVREARIDRAGCFAYSPVDGAAANALDRPAAGRSARGTPRALHGGGRSRCRRASSQNASARPCRCWWTMRRRSGRKGGVGRSYADAPEIDGQVRLLPPEKASKTLKVGEFTRARIVGTQGHDLVGLPL